MSNPERGGTLGEQKPLTPMERIRQAREALAAKQEAREKGKAAVEEERGRAAAKAKEAAEFSKRLGEVLAEAGAIETLTRFAERFPENPEASFALTQIEILADLASLSAEEWQEKYGGTDTNREKTLEKAQKMLKDERFIEGLRKKLGEKDFAKLSKD